MSCWRVNTTSTRSPGSTKPATPSTSLTRMVTAFIPSCRTADNVARWPEPVIFDARIGSFSSIGVSTTRRPLAVSSAIVVKAPAITASVGQAISRSDIEPSSAPKRSGFEATTMVWVAIGFFCDSRLFARISAWLVSQACARQGQHAAPGRAGRRIRSSLWCWNARALSPLADKRSAVASS